MPGSAAACRLGNSLPRGIRMNTNLPGFRAKQNMHLLGLFLLSHSPNEGEKKEEENKDKKGVVKTKRMKG